MQELEKLYNVLSREGLYTKTFEEFQVQYDDPSYRDRVFKTISDIIFDSKFIKRLRFLIKKELNIDLGNVKDNLSDSKSSISSIK